MPHLEAYPTLSEASAPVDEEVPDQLGMERSQQIAELVASLDITPEQAIKVLEKVWGAQDGAQDEDPQDERNQHDSTVAASRSTGAPAEPPVAQAKAPAPGTLQGESLQELVSTS